MAIGSLFKGKEGWIKGGSDGPGTSGKLGSKQKTQRGFMYPLNIAMGMDVYTFEEERKGFEIEERGTKCTEMYSQ